MPAASVILYADYFCRWHTSMGYSAVKMEMSSVVWPDLSPSLSYFPPGLCPPSSALDMNYYNAIMAFSGSAASKRNIFLILFCVILKGNHSCWILTPPGTLKARGGLRDYRFSSYVIFMLCFCILCAFLCTQDGSRSDPSHGRGSVRRESGHMVSGDYLYWTWWVIQLRTSKEKHS